MDIKEKYVKKRKLHNESKQFGVDVFAIEEKMSDGNIIKYYAVNFGKLNQKIFKEENPEKSYEKMIKYLNKLEQKYTIIYNMHIKNDLTKKDIIVIAKDIINKLKNRHIHVIHITYDVDVDYKIFRSIFKYIAYNTNLSAIDVLSKVKVDDKIKDIIHEEFSSFFKRNNFIVIILSVVIVYSAVLTYFYANYNKIKEISTITTKINYLIDKYNLSKNLKNQYEVYNIANAILKYSKMYDVDVDLIIAIIYAESSFYWKAISSVGACGYMQVYPVVWADTLKISYNSNDNNYIFDTDYNIRIGTYILRYFLDRNNGNVFDAVYSYNAGVFKTFKYDNKNVLVREESIYYIRKVIDIYLYLKNNF